MKFEKLYKVKGKLYSSIKDLAEYFNKPYGTVRSALTRAGALELKRIEIFGTTVIITTKQDVVKTWENPVNNSDNK